MVPAKMPNHYRPPIDINSSWRSRAPVDLPPDTSALPDPHSTNEISAYMQRVKDGSDWGQIEGYVEKRLAHVSRSDLRVWRKESIRISN